MIDHEKEIEDARTRLEECREATARSQAALDTLREKRPAAMRTYSRDMSVTSRGELASLDEKIREHELELEARGLREREASELYEATVRCERRARIKALCDEWDHHAIELAAYRLFVEPLVAMEREISSAHARMQMLLAQQRHAAREVEGIASELGEPSPLVAVDPDLLRAAAGIAIGFTRKSEHREHEDVASALVPILGTYTWDLTTHRKVSTGVSDEQFTRACRLIERCATNGDEKDG